jgi:transposase
VLEFFGKLPRCLVGIEARLGPEVKPMPAQYVEPYVKRGKNDAADAEAICEPVARPTMRFVGVKTPEQQSIMMLHRVRLILMRQLTQLSNALRSYLAEFGIVSPFGREGLSRLLTIVADTDDGGCPPSPTRSRPRPQHRALPAGGG